MTHYVTSMAMVSSGGFTAIPGREGIVLSMALVGLLLLAAAVSVLLKEEGGLSVVPVERDR